jgi:hypothetical protein
MPHIPAPSEGKGTVQICTLRSSKKVRTFGGTEVKYSYFLKFSQRRPPNSIPRRPVVPRRLLGMDICDQGAVADFFWGYSTDIAIGIHIAMQPSHNWRRRYRVSTSRSTPAVGSTFWRVRGNICPDPYFIFTSTDEVHGDTLNRLLLVEQYPRWGIGTSGTHRNPGAS